MIIKGQEKKNRKKNRQPEKHTPKKRQIGRQTEGWKLAGKERSNQEN